MPWQHQNSSNQHRFVMNTSKGIRWEAPSITGARQVDGAQIFSVRALPVCVPSALIPARIWKGNLLGPPSRPHAIYFGCNLLAGLISHLLQRSPEPFFRLL